MRRNRRRLVAVLSVALQLALGFGLTGNLVFCTAATGHVAVESAYSADCCEDHVLPEGARRLTGDQGCGCVDTPVLQSPVEARQRLDYVPPYTQSLPAFLSPHMGAASAAPGPRFTRRSCVPDGALHVRRSVVLLV